MAVTVELTDNFSRELGSDFYIGEGFGSKSEAPKPELSPNYVAASGSSVGANKNLKGTLKENQMLVCLRNNKRTESNTGHPALVGKSRQAVRGSSGNQCDGH